MSYSFDLPQELFLEILLRLSIQDLVKCTAVCKSWNSIIKNPTFISTHLKKTIALKNSTDTRLLLFRLCTNQPAKRRSSLDEPYDECVEHYSLRLDNKYVEEHKQLQFPSKKFQSLCGCFRVAGSYNGLVCLVDDMRCYVHNFIIWNPTIQKAVRTARPIVTFFSHGPFDAFVGFGFDSETNDYKLLRFVQLDNFDYDYDQQVEVCVEVEVYSLNFNCWKLITDIAPSYGLINCSYKRTYGHSFVNGAIHLLAYYDRKGIDGENVRFRNVVLAFDDDDE